jgi:hypothetical protein
MEKQIDLASFVLKDKSEVRKNDLAIKRHLIKKYEAEGKVISETEITRFDNIKKLQADGIPAEMIVGSSAYTKSGREQLSKFLTENRKQD